MKKVGFFLLSFFIGVYFTIGGFSLFVYFVFLSNKLGHRDFLINSDEVIIPPYPLGIVIGFFASLVVFLVIDYILIHTLIKFQSKYVSGKPILKFTLLVILVFCGFLLAREGIYVWQATPPMSKERAIQIAMEESKPYSTLTSEYSRRIFKDIQWDKINHYWIVKFSNQEGTSCHYININRIGTSFSIGTCNE